MNSTERAFLMRMHSWQVLRSGILEIKIPLEHLLRSSKPSNKTGKSGPHISPMSSKHPTPHIVQIYPLLIFYIILCSDEALDWLESQFVRLGLEVYSQNFTATRPVSFRTEVLDDFVSLASCPSTLTLKHLGIRYFYVSCAYLSECDRPLTCNTSVVEPSSFWH